MKTVRFTFKGDLWNVYLVPAAEMEHLAGDADVPAYVEPIDQEIYFSDDSELNLPNVLHELWHVAFSYQYIASANLTSDQTEEVSAEVFSTDGERLVRLAHELLTVLKELRDLKNKEDVEINLDERKEKARQKK